MNTTDGAVWLRRHVTRDGHGLYAVADAPACCPPFVMATLAELAAHGIVGSADALPMPVGPEPKADPVAAGRALDLLALMDERAASVVSPVLAAVLDEVERLRTERHSTNESVDTASEALRVQRDRIAELEQGPALPWAHAMSDHDLHEFLGDLVSAAMGRWQSDPEVPDRTVLANVEKACAAWRTPGKGNRLDGSGLDGIVRLVAPVQALRDEDPFGLHHSYRVGRDLPEPGGAG